VAVQVGPERVGVKLQPGVTFSDLIEPEDDVFDQIKYLGPELAKRKLAFVELSSLNDAPYYKFLGERVLVCFSTSMNHEVFM
jgi:N-ethylmaleimide reductase